MLSILNWTDRLIACISTWKILGYIHKLWKYLVPVPYIPIPVPSAVLGSSMYHFMALLLSFEMISLSNSFLVLNFVVNLFTIFFWWVLLEHVPRFFIFSRMCGPFGCAPHQTAIAPVIHTHCNLCTLERLAFQLNSCCQNHLLRFLS